jgi:hypothetical protein
MTIEVVPRSPRGEGRWRAATGSAEAPPARHDEVDGLGAVRVPVVPRRLKVPVGFSWLLLILMFNAGNVLRGARAGWSAVTVSSGLFVGVALVLLLVLYRALRLRPLQHRQERDLVLSAAGIHTSGLVVPWTQVQEVVRFGFHAGPGRGGPGPRRFVAVRVGDFVGVRGLTPARAGLANLTRRNLVVLYESREVQAPTELARALELLVANPAARELLSGAEGVRMATVGPPPGA